MAEPTLESGGAAHNEAAAVDTAPPAKAKGPGRDPVLTARDELLARMDEQIVQERAAEHERFLASSDVDPRAAALAAAMAKEARGEAIATDKGHRNLEQGAEELEDGAASVQPFKDEAERKAKEAVRISHKGEDPLGDYVVRVDGKPMFRTTVDGQEKLIPLDAARAELQKHIAANIRLQSAAARQKELDAREAALRKREATPVKAHPSATPVDETALAREVVRSLVTETEEQAAAKLAKTFKTIRQAATPQIDLNQVREVAATTARQTVAVERTQAAFQDGFTQFQKDYPEIAKDSDLFALADKRSETIGNEHPDWTPEAVMKEAGRQTREWMKAMGFTPSAPKNGTPPASTDPIRQQRKDNLVPVPQPRSARPAVAEAEEDNSPTGTLAEIRKSRGQPY